VTEARLPPESPEGALGGPYYLGGRSAVECVTHFTVLTFNSNSNSKFIETD